MSAIERLHAAHVNPVANVEHIGIAFKHGHVGILFRRTASGPGELRLLHLAFHHDVRCSSASTKYEWRDVDIEPERQVLVAQLCELIEQEYVQNHSTNRQKLSYAFHYHGEQFDPLNGVFITQDGRGLTCATFVLAAFASHGIDLLHLATWEARVEDAKWQLDVVDVMRREGVDEEHVLFVEKEIGCCRFRPEEVAAAGTVNGIELPLGFRDAESRGQRIVAELLSRASA